MRKLILAMALAMWTSPVAEAQWWWPPSCAVQPPNPTCLDLATITLWGEWPNSCVPNGSSARVLGPTIYVDVLHNYPHGIICLDVIMSWSISETVGPLPPGAYTVIATLYEGPIPVRLTPVCTIVVSPPARADVDADGDVDLVDFKAFQDESCMTGPCSPSCDPALQAACAVFDVDCDGDIDLADLAQWQNAFTGP